MRIHSARLSWLFLTVFNIVLITDAGLVQVVYHEVEADTKFVLFTAEVDNKFQCGNLCKGRLTCKEATFALDSGICFLRYEDLTATENNPTHVEIMVSSLE